MHIVKGRFFDHDISQPVNFAKEAERLAKDLEMDDLLSRIYMDSPNPFGPSLSKDELKPLYVVRGKDKKPLGFAGARKADATHELVLGILPEHRGQGHGSWAARKLIERHPEIKNWRTNVDTGDELLQEFVGKLGFQPGEEEMDGKRQFTRRSQDRSLIEQMGAPKEAADISPEAGKILAGIALGTGAAELENQTILKKQVPREHKNINLLIGAVTGGVLGHGNTVSREVALSSLPFKQLGLLAAGTAAKKTQAEKEMAETNLRTALTNLQSARSPIRNIAMGLGAAGAAGLGAYGVHRMMQDIRQRQQPEGEVTIRLPGAHGKSPATVQVPFEALPESIYRGLIRDTKRTARQEVDLNQLHRRLREMNKNSSAKEARTVSPDKIKFLADSIRRSMAGKSPQAPELLKTYYPAELAAKGGEHAKIQKILEALGGLEMPKVNVSEFQKQIQNIIPLDRMAEAARPLHQEMGKESQVNLIKDAIIRSVGGGKYVVMSHKGKRLSKPKGLGATKKRLSQIEYFKHKG